MEQIKNILRPNFLFKVDYFFSQKIRKTEKFLRLEGIRKGSLFLYLSFYYLCRSLYFLRLCFRLYHYVSISLFITHLSFWLFVFLFVLVPPHSLSSINLNLFLLYRDQRSLSLWPCFTISDFSVLFRILCLRLFVSDSVYFFIWLSVFVSTLSSYLFRMSLFFLCLSLCLYDAVTYCLSLSTCL